MFIQPTDKKTFQSIILLDLLVQGPRKFTTILNGDDRLLETLFLDLMAAKAVEIHGGEYAITPLGRTGYENFMRKYTEYLKVFDVYSFVDLDAGEFAFSKFFDFKTDEEWDIFKNNLRFKDLRIAVALYKKMNAPECVFMSFINENRFDTNRTAWQMDLISNGLWDEIEAICDTAIKPEQLGSDAMNDIINQGSIIMVDLIKKEMEENAARESIIASNDALDAGNTSTTTVTEEVVEEVEDNDWMYYESYYDPFYVPIFWYDPIIVW